MPAERSPGSGRDTVIGLRIFRLGGRAQHLLTIMFYVACIFAASHLIAGRVAAQVQLDIAGPAGSGNFGFGVYVLPNGNFVVTDPGYDAPGPVTNVGAVYLYDGNTRALISTLTGSTANDRVGLDGVTVLGNGNFVVISSGWDNGAAVDAGAVTWGSAVTGVAGVVSASNSIVSASSNSFVGNVTPLTNGNYVVTSFSWSNGTTASVGAATWGNGTTGTAGVISAANSLIGTTTTDQVGSLVVALPNGNYVVSSPRWDNGATVDAGAVTWGNGAGGTVGAVSSANSLVGSSLNDLLGQATVVVLTNGNYVVPNRLWDNGATADVGAVTWASGTSGTAGSVSAANSLIGTAASDGVGSNVIALTNGNYVVTSPAWNDGAVVDAGAATWGNGTTGTVGTVSAANSLVGTAANNMVGAGFGGAVALTNGNYVVLSPQWDNGAATNVGAATWRNGTGAFPTTVSPLNSLIGSSINDFVGNGAVALTNGNYVIRSPSWSNLSIADVGAVTLADGTGPLAGTIGPVNSLIGTTANDQIGNSVIALSNGNYVVNSSEWDNGGIVDAGAVTFSNGLGGITGAISSVNSLVGSTANDRIGSFGTTALTNGNYLVGNPTWDNGGITDAGAVTFGNGTSGVAGIISSTNSLVGTSSGDRVGNIAYALSNGNYVVASTNWDDGSTVDAGAVTWGNGTTGVAGAVSSSNSLVGISPSDRLGSVTGLPNGNYVIGCGSCDNGAVANAGLITVANGMTGLTGTVTGVNGVKGEVTDSGFGMVSAAFPSGSAFLIGRSNENIVTIFLPFAPTAAGVSVSGQVTTPEGYAIPRVRVTMTDADGTVRMSLTNAFGYYRFDDVPAGDVYVVEPSAKGHVFAPRAIKVFDSLSDVDFVSERLR